MPVLLMDIKCSNLNRRKALSPHKWHKARTYDSFLPLRKKKRETVEVEKGGPANVVYKNNKHFPFNLA